LKDLTAGPFAFTSDSQGLAILFYDDLLKRFQVLFDVRPFKTVARVIKTSDLRVTSSRAVAQTPDLKI
jgi:hypothetical protein